MRTLYIIDIEPLDNRYTKQWHEWIPLLADAKLGDQFEIVQISGTPYAAPQAGAFFNFASTCTYKAEQAVQIAQLFERNEVRDGDVFFFTDAWNQTVHTVKYISELNDINVKCVGIWHAGWYDPTDILGMKIVNQGWVSHLERSMAMAYDLNIFGTEQHLKKFLHKYPDTQHKRMEVCGYPLEYINGLRNDEQKENVVVFPHRLNEDKAPYLFDMLETTVRETYGRNDITFVKTQQHNLSKEYYYDLLKKCKVVFSANKHENLGIGTFEAMSAGCIPLVPNKLSYAEMYSAPFKYDIDPNATIYDYPGLYLDSLGKLIINFVDNYDDYEFLRQQDITRIQRDFFSGDKMMELLGQM